MSRPLSKDQALRSLGVARRDVRRTVAPYVDFDVIESGRILVNQSEHYGDVLIGVSGAVAVRGPDHSLSLNDGFVFDSWMLDADRRSVLEVTASSPVTLLRVNWQYRYVVFECMPDLVACSEKTRDQVLGPAGIDSGRDPATLDMAV